MLKIKSTISEMKNYFCGFINKLDAPENRMNRFGDMSIEIIQTELF